MNGNSLNPQKSSQKVDRAVENPKRSLGSLSESAADFNYLKRQKESIEKVDQLIEEAEQSLKELRKEFYQNTLQDMSVFTQKVSQAGVTVSKSTIEPTNSVEVTSSLYKMLRLSRVKKDSAASGGSVQQHASIEIEYSEGAQSPDSQAGLRKKSSYSTKRLLSDTKRTPSVTKKTSSLSKKTFSDTKKTHSATRKSYTDTKKTSETGSSGGVKSVLATSASQLSSGSDEAEADRKTDDLEVEMVNVNLLPDKASVMKQSKSVTLTSDVQLENYSVHSGERVDNEPIQPVPMPKTTDITNDDLPVSKFLGVKNSIFLKVLSSSDTDVLCDADIHRKCSVRISSSKPDEIRVFPPEPDDNSKEMASQQVDDESVQDVLVDTEKESDQNRSTNTPEDLAETDASESIPTSMEEMPNDSNQILNDAEEPSPQMSDHIVRNEPEPRKTGLCCECSPYPDNNVPSANIDNELDVDCSCKAELEMLRSSPCYRILTSRLKSPGSTKKAPKKTSFCTECYTFNSGEVERDKISRGNLKDIFPDEPPQSTDTDDSYLNTISERTEPTSAAISQECVPNKCKQLTVQHLPQISIKPPLVIQKVFEIEIKPTGSVQMQIPVIQNIRYDEVLHAECEDVISPVLTEDIGEDEANKLVDESVTVVTPNIPVDKSQIGSPAHSIKDILTEKHSAHDNVSHMLEFNDDQFMISQSSTDDKPDVSAESETKAEKLDEDDGSHLTTDTVDELGCSLPKYDKPDSTRKMLKKASVTIQARTSSEPRQTSTSKNSLHLKSSLKSIKSDYAQIENKTDVHPRINVTLNTCGCEDGEDHSTYDAGLILDQAFDRKCDCDYIRDSVGMLELKKSLHEVDKMARELNQSLSARLLEEDAPSNNKLNFRLMDVGDQHDESVTDDGDVDQEEEIRQYRANDSPFTSTNNPDEEQSALSSTPPLKKISDMKELRELSNTENNAQERPENQSDEYDESRRPTPLFTQDIDLPEVSKLPKSISEFFGEPDILSLEENVDVNDPEPLSEISDLNDGGTVKTSNTELGTDQLVKNILCELDKDLDDLGETNKQIIAVNCQCICKKESKRLVEVIPPIVGPSNTRKTASSSRSSSGQKLGGRKKRKSETSGIGKPFPLASNKSPPKTSARSSLSSKNNSIRSNPPPVFAAFVSMNSSDKAKSISRQQSSHSTIRKVATQHVTREVVDPNVKESLMGAFDLSEEASGYEVPSRVLSTYKRTPTASPKKSSICSPVDNSPSPINDPATSQSEESVYVLTHDVSTQISLESVQSERRQSTSSRSDKKAPRVTISINHDDLKVRGSMNGYSKKNKKVDSKDQNQQISQDNIDIIASPPLEEITTEKKTVTNLENTSENGQTVVLRPVMVYYESRGVQKSLEDWAYPPVKLHKMPTCNDIESTSTNETDYESLPCRNAPCGDIPTSLEFLPINSTRVLNRNYDVDERASPSPPTRHLKIFRSPQYNYASSSTDTTDSRLEECISEGEIKCRCTVSVGELHNCRPKNGSKIRTAYLKNHPEALVRYEFPSDNVHLLRHRKLYENWVTYYTSKTSTTNGSDTTEVSTDT